MSDQLPLSRPPGSLRPWQFADTAAVMSWVIPTLTGVLAMGAAALIVALSDEHIPLWWLPFLAALFVGFVLATLALILNPGEPAGRFSWLILQAVLGYAATFGAGLVILVAALVAFAGLNVKNPQLLEEARLARQLEQMKQQGIRREQQMILEEEQREKQIEENRRAEAKRRKDEFDKQAASKRYAAAMFKRLTTGEDGKQIPTFTGSFIAWHDHECVHSRLDLPATAVNRPLIDSEQVGQGWRVRKLQLAGASLVPAVGYAAETNGNAHVYLAEKKGTLLEISPTDWRLRRQIDLGGPCTDLASHYSQILIARTKPGAILTCGPSAQYPDTVSTLVTEIAQTERLFARDNYDIEVVTSGSEPLWAVLGNSGRRPNFIQKVAEVTPAPPIALFDSQQRLRTVLINKERQFLAARKDGIYRGTIPGNNDPNYPLPPVGQISFDEKNLNFGQSIEWMSNIAWQQILPAQGINLHTFAATERGTFFTSSDQQNLLVYGSDGKQIGAWQWPGAGKTLFIGTLRGTTTCVVLTEKNVFILTPEAGNAPPPGTKYVKNHLAIEPEPPTKEPEKLLLNFKGLPEASGVPGVNARSLGYNFGGHWLFDVDGKGATLFHWGFVHRVNPQNWSITKSVTLPLGGGFKHLKHSAAGTLVVKYGPNQLLVLDPQTFAVKHAWDLTGEFGSSYATDADFASSPNSNFVAFMLNSGEVFEVMDVTTGGVVAVLKAPEIPGQSARHTENVHAVGCSPDGKSLIVVTNRIHRYAVTTTGIQHAEMSEPVIGGTSAVSFSADSRRLLVHGHDLVRVFETNRLATPLHKLEIQTQDDVVLDPSGEFVWANQFAGDQMTELAKLDLTGEAQLQLKLDPSDDVLVFAPGGKRLFFGEVLVDLGN